MTNGRLRIKSSVQYTFRERTWDGLLLQGGQGLELTPKHGQLVIDWCVIRPRSSGG
jgi:hypothetical protein